MEDIRHCRHDVMIHDRAFDRNDFVLTPRDGAFKPGNDPGLSTPSLHGVFVVINHTVNNTFFFCTCDNLVVVPSGMSTHLYLLPTT